MAYEDIAAIKTAIDANTGTGTYDTVHAGLFLARDIMHRAKQISGPGYNRKQKIIILNDGMAGESFPAVGGEVIPGPGANGVTTPPYDIKALENPVFDYDNFLNPALWEDSTYPGITSPPGFLWFEGDSPANIGRTDITINGVTHFASHGAQHNGYHAIATIAEANLAKADGIGIYGIGLGTYFYEPSASYYGGARDVMAEICDPGQLTLVPDSAGFPNPTLTTAFKEIVKLIMGELSTGQVDVFTEIPSVFSLYAFPGKKNVEVTTTSNDPKLTQSASISGQKINWVMSHVPADGKMLLTYYVYIDPADAPEGMFNSIFEDESYITFDDKSGNRIVKYFPKAYIAPSGEIKLDIGKTVDNSNDTATSSPKTDGLIPMFVTSNTLVNPTVYTPSVTPNKKLIAEELLLEGAQEESVAKTSTTVNNLIAIISMVIIAAGAVVFYKKKQKDK